MKKYYTLVLREDGERWRPEFGSYTRQDVRDEMADYTAYDYRSCDAKITTSGEAQADIDAAVGELNK